MLSNPLEGLPELATLEVEVRPCMLSAPNSAVPAVRMCMHVCGVCGSPDDHTHKDDEGVAYRGDFVSHVRSFLGFLGGCCR